MGSGKRSLRRPKLSARNFSAWKKKICQWEDSSNSGGVKIEWDTLASDLSGLEGNAEKAKYMIMCPGEKRTKPGHKCN